ncbi:hypothetical protein WN71_031195 [Streptomyces mangrovisoli]|uniref:Uncharacterized protein n=1 Tax=Streptomyces mangrovisoli TaxID=1428628 RepID=A0A1J4NNJ9_9ACTN|nr:hypothetical protein WN71_031195 [Streptomyces mangrovisoli]
MRRAAQEGLDAVGPQADLFCWLALGHMVEDEDDHDDRAEEAFRRGLALDGDHRGLLAGYAELCRRADAFEYPGRAARADGLVRRVEELAVQSADAERWARPGYWDDLQMEAAARVVAGRDTLSQAWDLAEDLRRTGDDGVPVDGADGSPDRAAVVRATRLEALSGPWNAPVRLVGRYRTVVWSVSILLSLFTNTLLRQSGAVQSFSLWGYLWLLPVVIVDRRFAAVRKDADARYVARLEAALGEDS